MSMKCAPPDEGDEGVDFGQHLGREPGRRRGVGAHQRVRVLMAIQRPVQHRVVHGVPNPAAEQTQAARTPQQQPN